MRVLLVKTSSMGDIIHTFPALTDAGKALPGIRFDWVVEEAFAVIPTWHPLVDSIIPVALRRWRKGIFSAETRAGWRQLREAVNTREYDLVLDAQGLVKSALVTCCARGARAGLDWGSAREALASLAYQRKYKVNFHQHAVVRMRSLFSLALAYELPATDPDFGLDISRFIRPEASSPYLVFLHGTTWASKQWPISYWGQLANLADQAGYRVKVSGGNEEEMAKSREIAGFSQAVDVLPRLSIAEMARLIAGANGVVAVDTGFGHLSGALGVPTVSIYGSTNPDFTGALGKASQVLAADFPCSPCLGRTCSYTKPAEVTPACYASVPPARVWAALTSVM